MANTQFDFALDQDDPSTAKQAAFMVNPPFSKNLVIKNMNTQKSFLITDVRLRSIARKDESSIYGMDQWAVDVYHKLAGYESQPGVNTRVVDEMGHDAYDRYDNHSITPDTPTQKTTYRLSAREVDLLIHAGAYDDPASTEARLRKNLVGQTWSMPDRVQVSESRVRIPDQKSAIVLGDSQPQLHNRDFLVALVQDTGKKNLIDAHTPGSNMAIVIDSALRQMTPGVTPMADIHNDLAAANDVKALSKEHQIQSQVLDSELDFDDVPAQNNDELDLGTMQQPITSETQNSASPVIDHEDAANYREDLTIGAAQRAGVGKDGAGIADTDDKEAVAQDQSGIDEFLPDAPGFKPSSDNSQPESNDDAALDAEQAQEDQMFANTYEPGDFEADTQSTAPATESNLNQENAHQQKQRTIRTTEQSADNNMPNSQSTAGNYQEPQSEAMDLSQLDNAQAPSMDELQSMLSQLQAEGVTKGYQAPDYEKSAEQSPAAQREKLKLQRRLQQQQNAERSAANEAAKKARAQRQAKQPNVPDFDAGPDF